MPLQQAKGLYRAGRLAAALLLLGLCLGRTSPAPQACPGASRQQASGEYDLDNVGHHWFVNVAATSQRAEQRIMVCVRADGPKRVLGLVDLLVSCNTEALLCMTASSFIQDIAGCDLSSITWPFLLGFYSGICPIDMVVCLSFCWLYKSGNGFEGDQPTVPDHFIAFTMKLMQLLEPGITCTRCFV